MTVKNIMFSGVMAAILGATAAHAADPVQLISKSYADRELQSKLTAGANVAIAADNTISVDLTNYATNTAVTDAISNAVTAENGVVKNAIDAVQADVDALDEKVGELPTGEDAATTIVEYINKKTEGIATDAALGELQTAVDTAEDDIDALEAKVGNDTVANQIATAIANKADKATTLQGYGITDAYTKTEVDTELNKKANASDLEGYATDAELAEVSAVANAAQTAEEVGNAIDEKIIALDLANTYDAKGAASTAESAAKTYADDLNTAMDTRVDALEAIDHTKFATDEELAGVETTAEKGVADAATAKTAADNAQAAADAAQEDADANALAIQGLQNAGYVVGTKEVGQYLINFDATGNATYTAVTIVE